MPADHPIILSEEFFTSDTKFYLLMQKRIRNVLLICSQYDAFMLEEDGRVDEQIFNEYVSLNLRYPPEFIHASTAEEAFSILEEESIDLIINMLSVGDMDPFELSKKIKEKYEDKPIVVLTPFSREVSMKLKNEDLSAIDYVFCWLGHSDLLLAIIKLIEDKMNVEQDVDIGVQTIILVEDSIRFYSSYLPNMYKIIFNQSKEFMTEGLNEHQKTMRMRGRPKILLANNYEDAVELYQKYKNNLLGIISDISYLREGKLDKQSGIKYCKMVRADDEQMPFILQSSDVEYECLAERMKVGFINKTSPSLSLELRSYMKSHFSFGDFVFRLPGNYQEIDRAANLQELQNKILEIPDATLSYHISKNHFSKWLTARALFSIADVFRPVKPEQFKNLDEVRKYIFDSIAKYRYSKGRGIIAKFYKEKFDEYLTFSRIGDGSIGGKARGLAFIDSLLKRNKITDKYKGVFITIPRTVVLSTEIFDEFMEKNNLYEIALSTATDEEILQKFIKAKLPPFLNDDLKTFATVVKNPMAVRSSSLLEDSHYQPFAGIYSTYMVPKTDSNMNLMLQQLSNAIKCVYASVFFKASKAYMAATSNVIDEEKMGIILQEVCGKRYGNTFYPTFSGVARSINFYPIEMEKPEDGIASVALGLGKYIVEGGQTLRFSPQYPKKIIQLSSPEMALRDTQKYFYALDLDCDSFKPSTDDGINIKRMRIKEAEKANSIKDIASTFDFANHVIRDGSNHEGKKIITFANVLKYNTFPLAEILKDLLYIGQKEMNNPVEIEFAGNLSRPKERDKLFNFLQIRPIVENKEALEEDLDNIAKEDTIIYADSALGNGIIDGVVDLIYVKPDSFDPAKNPEIGERVEAINEKFIKENNNYVLIGPGRWGSTDPWLGIPVKWSQISAARVIVESGLENYRIDPSQGTHFFQNLTSFRVGYFTINPYINDGFYDVNFLNSMDAAYEDEFLRHIKFKENLTIKIDGKKTKGVIMKPGK